MLPRDRSLCLASGPAEPDQELDDMDAIHVEHQDQDQDQDEEEEEDQAQERDLDLDLDLDLNRMEEYMDIVLAQWGSDGSNRSLLPSLPSIWPTEHDHQPQDEQKHGKLSTTMAVRPSSSIYETDDGSVRGNRCDSDEEEEEEEEREERKRRRRGRRGRGGGGGGE